MAYKIKVHINAVLVNTKKSITTYEGSMSPLSNLVETHLNTSVSIPRYQMDSFKIYFWVRFFSPFLSGFTSLTVVLIPSDKVFKS